MAKCAYCGTSILFGGVKDGDFRFCNNSCHQKGHAIIVAKDIPKEVVDRHMLEIHRGLCPKCQGSGPVDVHTSYRVYSLLLYTSWSSRQHVGCKSCGRKAQVADLFFSLFLGWWGFPWGLIMTPVQVSRNLAGVFNSRQADNPSAQLENLVRVGIASHYLQQKCSA